jgi:site-specific DNA-cytosine methylase
VKPLIFDLCGGTGSWSKPYRDSGLYDVRIIDPQEWLPDDPGTGDVRLFELPKLKRRPRGILAAPPCTHFSVSGARWWPAKGEKALLEALSIADACIRFIHFLKPDWWAAENPVGRLRRYWGDPTYIFDPCDHGDPYTKKTLLWGEFNEPEKNPVEPTEGSKMHLLPPGPERARLRSATPQGFAQAFFKANP